MKPSLLPVFVGTAILLTLAGTSAEESPRAGAVLDRTQVPKWSRADLEFFLHGSMSAEVVPERVLRAFMTTYPDLFPTKDLLNFGLIPDPPAAWPVGVSQREVPHLAGMSSIGVNCAACHVGDVDFGSHIKPARVLGTTSHFDAEAFFGAVVAATFRTSKPANMKFFLESYLTAGDRSAGAKAREFLTAEWNRQEEEIIGAIASDPFASSELPAGNLHAITASDVRLDARLLENGVDLPRLVRSMLKLFHNMRAALHVPDEVPPPSPPNGPGRNDPWRVLSYSLLGIATAPAPVKFGLVWNEDRHTWVHFDANTRSPIVRNLAASLGLGAPLIGHTGIVDFAAIERHTALSETIKPPRYPLSINHATAARGAKIYRKDCAACHDGPDNDQRLHAFTEIQTDPNRAEIFTPEIAEQFNLFFADLRIPGYRPPEKPIRSTQKYWAPSLPGVWARSPYLHNGSVRTLRELLTSPDKRANSFRRGSRVYDPAQMGYIDLGTYVLDTAQPGSSDSGHDYGANLSDAEKRDLMEYLKTL